MKVQEYNEMMAYMLRPRQKFAIGGGVIEGEDLGSREGFNRPRLDVPGLEDEVKKLFNKGLSINQVLKNLKEKPEFEKVSEGVVKRIKKEFNLGAKSADLLSSQADKYNKLKELVEQSNNQLKFVEMETLRERVGLPKRKAPTDQANIEKFNVPKLDKAKDKVRKTFLKIINNPNIPAEEVFDISSKIGRDTNLSPASVSQFLQDIPEYQDFKPTALKLQSPAFKAKIVNKNKTLSDIIEMADQIPVSGTTLSGANTPERFIINSVTRHINQGGDKVQWVKAPGNIDRQGNLITEADSVFRYKGKDYNYYDLVAKGRGMKEFKEVYENYDKLNDLLSREVIDPITKQKITFKELMQKAYNKGANFSSTSNPYEIDHFNTVKNEPFSNLRILPYRINRVQGALKNKAIQALKGFLKPETAKMYTPDKIKNYLQKSGYNFTKDINQIFKDEVKLANDILVKNRKLKTPIQIGKDIETQKFNKLLEIPGVTTADKAPIPEATKTRNMFKRAGKLGLVGGLIAATAGKAEEIGQTREVAGPFDYLKEDEGFTTTEKLLAGTTAGATYAARKPILKTLGAIARPVGKVLGAPSIAAGLSLSNILDYEKPEDASVLDRLDPRNYKVQDDPDLKMAGLDLLLPELIKKGAPRGSGIMSMIGRGLANPFGRAARAFTPVGATLTAAGIGKDYYDFAKDEIAKVKAMTPEERAFYNDLLMDEGGMIDISREGFNEGGPSDPSRRKFMKIMGGLASLPIVGKFFRVAEQTPVVQNIFTEIQKLKNSETLMPDWFPTFLNKFRKEGTAENIFKKKKVEVSKAEYDKAFAEGKGQDYYTDVARTQEYKANNPNHMDYFKYENTDELIGTTYTNEKVPGVKVDDFDGEVSVNWENDYSQPVAIQYVKPGMPGSDLGRLDKYEQGFADKQLKPEGEFAAVDQEVYATDPDGGFEATPTIVNSLDDMMEGTTRVMEEYATGNPVRTLSKGEGKVIEAEIRAEQAAESAAEMADDFDDFQ